MAPLLFALLLLTPTAALAHHPGALGPVTHLGFTQIAEVIGAALLDAANPTALGVLLLLIHTAVSQNKPFRRTGALYVLGIFAAYITGGIVLRNIYLNVGPTLPVLIFQMLLAALLFMSGASEASDAIVQDASEKKTPADTYASHIAGWLEKGFAFPLGVVIGAIELFATGAVYLAFIQAVTYDPTAPARVVYTLMAIYLAFFMLPLVAVLISTRFADLTLGKKRHTKAGRWTRGILGAIFMLAAAWIAASAYMTIEAIL